MLKLKLNKSVIGRGHNSSTKDFEDALQYFIVKESDCEIIIAINGKDFKKLLLPVMTSDEF